MKRLGGSELGDKYKGRKGWNEGTRTSRKKRIKIRRMIKVEKSGKRKRESRKKGQRESENWDGGKRTRKMIEKGLKKEKEGEM